MQQRQCRQCGEWYEPIFFESNLTRTVRGMHTSYKRAICKGCSQTNRDKHKAISRWRSKMRSTRKMHARKFNRSEAEFENIFKWNLDQMEHDARHAYDNGCPNCGRNFAAMGHGLSDITLDIIVREAPPTYGHNTRWICGTCNRQKGKYTMQEYATLMMEWRRWEQRAKDKWFGTLLEGLSVDMGSKTAMEYRRRG